MNHSRHPSQRLRLTVTLRVSSLALALLCTPLPRLDAQNTNAEATGELEELAAIGAEDPISILPKEPVDSIFGFKKTLLETPRSVSTLSDDMMESYGIESALDVQKLVPSTFTTSIFGINGNVNIRGVPSDTYFRGVKRLENTQMFPSPITAMARLDVVRGPPSPVFGPGKMGGYSNFIPKSARASTGKYLSDTTGKATVTYGSYDRKAATFEFGGPMSLFGKKGGYYAYLNALNSDTYYNNVYYDQYIVQSSFDLQLTDTVRIEFGQMYQYWAGKELAGWNRITQELIDTGMYNAGLPLLNMDRDGDGLISTAEVDYYGPLLRTIPATATTEQARALLGPGWTVDPATTGKVKISRRANAQSSEDDGQANITLGYFDIIVEPNDDVTLTSKTYTEFMNRYKWTRASGYGQDTSSWMLEQKFLYDRSLPEMGDWLKGSFSASALVRFYDTYNVGGSKYADLVNRADLSRPFNIVNRFAVPNREPHLAPWNNGLKSDYVTGGPGAMLDVVIKEKTNLTVGARYDWVDATSSVPSHVLNAARGTTVSGKDEGFSYTASLSYEIAKGIRPYGTYSEQKTLIVGIDGGIGQPVVADGPLNGVELREYGIKASLFEDKLFATVSHYYQTRTSFTFDTGQVLSTLGKGVEFELRWVPMRSINITAGATKQKTTYEPVRPATISVSPTFFGLPDDDYFGGRIQTTLAGEPQYAERSGYPRHVFTLNGTYIFPKGLSVNLSASYQDEVPSGRIKDITLPDALILGTAISYDREKWGVRLSINNLTNELYFTPNSPDGLGELIVIPAPERNYQVTLTYKF
ncbi:MAG: TonB-dependent receptor [Opitutaceae bacterium]|nr:TonB-dependent receptor [Opitutaceae bacterium]